MPGPIELDSTYVHLGPAGEVTPMPAGPEFWATIGERRELEQGFLVTRARMTSDWPHWEMHPQGEELVTLLSGRVTLVLDDGRRESRVELAPGQTWINQRGTWHRALVHEPSELLFMTAGWGTEHRPVEG